MAKMRTVEGFDMKHFRHRAHRFYQSADRQYQVLARSQTDSTRVRQDVCMGSDAHSCECQCNEGGVAYRFDTGGPASGIHRVSADAAREGQGGREVLHSRHAGQPTQRRAQGQIRAIPQRYEPSQPSGHTFRGRRQYAFSLFHSSLLTHALTTHDVFSEETAKSGALLGTKTLRLRRLPTGSLVRHSSSSVVM
jgi:hypothetical protein